jgi:hypothetical protein
LLIASATSTTQKPGEKNISDIIIEEVVRENVEENTNVNLDDFEDTQDVTDTPVDEPKPAKEPEPTPPVNDPPPNLDHPKNKAVSKLMNTNTIITFYNVVAGRAGKMFNKKNPDCLKFDDEDKEDVGLLLKATVEEENWAGVPAKWLLLMVIVVLVVGKIFAWNTPAGQKNLSNPEADKKIGELETKLLAIEQKHTETLQLVATLQEQNQLLKNLLDKKTGNAPAPAKYFRGFDLSNPAMFTKNGALIDPSKAGQKGYTDEGKKMGYISQSDREIFAKWKEYQDYLDSQDVAA